MFSKSPKIIFGLLENILATQKNIPGLLEMKK
jgi:hypothetical protein